MNTQIKKINKMEKSTSIPKVMRTLLVFFGVSITLLLSTKYCSVTKETTDQTGGSTHRPAPPVPGKVKEFRTRTGKRLFLKEEHPAGESLSTIIITPEGLKDNYPIMFEEVDPMRDAILADLNHDGFDELYIITEGVGSGSYKNIIGVASYQDKFLSGLVIPEIREKDMAEGMRFQGYMGKDSIAIKDSNIIRTFSLYREDDSSANPTGWKRSIYYRMKTGTVDRLEIDKVENKKNE